MIDWSDEQQMLREAVRQFIEKEIVPIHDDLEHGDLPTTTWCCGPFAAWAPNRWWPHCPRDSTPWSGTRVTA